MHFLECDKKASLRNCNITLHFEKDFLNEWSAISVAPLVPHKQNKKIEEKSLR